VVRIKGNSALRLEYRPSKGVAETVIKTSQATIFADSWLANHELILLDACLSVVCRLLSVCLPVVCLSATFAICGQTVQDGPMVTMGHYFEVNVGLSESANLTLDDLDKVISISRK
jgi:hypothetical protein